MTRTAFDVSDPAGPIAGFDICCFYIGGDTPHVWTRQQLVEQPARWRLPIWVTDHAADGEKQGQLCTAALDAIGCPRGVAVALDVETLRDPAMVNAFADIIHAHKRLTVPYGSPATLFYNPPRSGYWVANPTNQPHMYEHPHTVGTQWTWKGRSQSGQRIDESQFTDGLPLWDTRPVAPAPAPNPRSEALADLGTASSFIATAVKLIVNDWK